MECSIREAVVQVRDTHLRGVLGWNPNRIRPLISKPSDQRRGAHHVQVYAAVLFLIFGQIASDEDIHRRRRSSAIRAQGSREDMVCPLHEGLRQEARARRVLTVRVCRAADAGRA